MFEWMPSDDLIAQLAHVGWGCLLVLVFGLWGHYFWGAGGVLVYASVKEWVFDKYIERQSFEDNLHDYIYWMVGLFTGLMIGLLRVVTR